MLARRHRNSGRQNVGTRSASHRKWVRGHECAVLGCASTSNIECAHVEGSGTKGMGMKAADVYTIPLCRDCHAERHRIGWRTFDARYGLDALALAKELAAKSPHIQRAAREAGYLQEEMEE